MCVKFKDTKKCKYGIRPDWSLIPSVTDAAHTVESLRCDETLNRNRKRFYYCCISAGQLEAVKLNLHKQENRATHRTDEYEIDQLILRRGQEFDVTVTFNRDYIQKPMSLRVQFVTGNIFS